MELFNKALFLSQQKILNQFVLLFRKNVIEKSIPKFFLHEGYTADYFLNRMKPNALFPILFIQNNKKKNQVATFFIRLLHMCLLEKFYRVIFLFSRFDWSIFVTQLVAKH
jgi:hypothetical protein